MLDARVRLAPPPSTFPYLEALKHTAEICYALQTPYLHFVGQLARAFNTRPMVLVECRHVSVNLTARAVTPDAVVAAMVQILRRHKWATGAFIGHSYAPLLHAFPALAAACEA